MAYHTLEESGEQGGSVWLIIHYRRVESRDAQCDLQITRGEQRADRFRGAFNSLEESGKQGGSVWLTIHWRSALRKEAQFGILFVK